MKDIKDYLHLYLGCEVKIEGQPNAILGAVGIKNGEQVIIRWPMEDEWSYADTNEIKPILRPLSSMTEEEIKECEINSKVSDDGYKRLFPFESMRYLLSKHFDLFGLIDAGLAIDSTKQ